MFQTVFSAVQNFGQFLPYKRVKRNHGRWETLPCDIMERVLRRLNLSDRIRLSIVCKAWKSIVMRRDIRSTLQCPWLVLPQQNSKFLSFSILPEGKVVEMKLPTGGGGWFQSSSQGKVVEMKLPKGAGGWFHRSSQGWLVMFKEQGLESKIFLWNPISRSQHQLPSLTTIPSFENCHKGKNWTWKSSTLGYFVHRIVLSSSNISECIVAATFTTKVLGLCRPGGKSWSAFQVLDDIQNDLYLDILFSGGKLYTLLKSANGIKCGTITDQTLNFGGSAVELKLVYDKPHTCIKSVYQGGYVFISKGSYMPFLIESKAKNEVLLIHQIKDVFNSNIAKEYRTSDFTIYKIDTEKSSLFKVESLVNQVLFLANYGSLCYPASAIKGCKGNVIYFESDILQVNPAESIGSPVSNESSVFYLDGGKIVRSFSSHVDTSTECGYSWFSPSL